MKEKPASPLKGDTRTGSTESTRQTARVEATVELPPGAEVVLTVQYKADEQSVVQTQVVNLSGGPEPTTRHLIFDLFTGERKGSIKLALRTGWAWFAKNAPTPAGLFVAAILVYYLVRLIRLADYPIFFFTDEAVHTMLAFDLVRSDFVGSGEEFLPTFFKSGSTFNAGFPVYLQVLPVLMGIRSIFVTRFLSVTVTLLAAIGLGGIYSQVHSKNRAWLAVLVLSIIPAWFYHTRTAFETVEAVSFYTIFLLGYIKYRDGEFRWLYFSLLGVVMAFYSYSPARVVMAATAVCFLISDARYHWKNRKQLWKPFLLGLALSLPYFRFLYLHPGENQHHLELLNSYWVKSEPITWKLLHFGKEYLQGLNPVYWFLPNHKDLSRHVMEGIGHLAWYFLPFFTGGFILSLSKWKDPKYRVMIFALFMAPTGAAVAEIGITRAMFMVIPAAFFITIGIEYCIEWFLTKINVRKTYDVVFFLLFVGLNFLFLDKVLTEGPVWHKGYGMAGMQYGAGQVFGRIAEIREKDPKVPIVLSPDWANGTDVLARFFLGDPVPIDMASMDAYTINHETFEPETIFIMPPDDYNKIIKSGKFETMQLLDMLPYPDGTAGFIFANLKYSESAGDNFDVEVSSRHQMKVEKLKFYGEDVEVAASLMDMGSLSMVFDHDPTTLVRSLEANPLVVEIILAEPKTYRQARVTVGGSATQITVYALTELLDVPLVSSVTVSEAPEIRDAFVPMPTDIPVTRLRFEVRTAHDGEPAHVHLWGIELE